MAITELVELTLKPNSHIGDPENEAAKVLRFLCETLTATDGLQQIYFGTAIEDESKLRVLIDWESLEKHKAFMSSDRYGSFVGKIKEIVTAPPSIFHVDFEPKGAHSQALEAPVTEIVAFNFEGDVPGNYSQGVDTFVTEAKSAAKGIAWGTTHETIEKDSVKGKAAVFLLGWDSVDAHMAFRDTAVFKQVAPGLKGTAKASSMHHIQAMKYLG